jgi:hypothetical protein
MALKTTRRILSVILTVIIAVSSISLFASIVLDNTFASQKFISKHFVTDSLVAECDKQLDVKFEALEKKCSIPAHVFQTIKKQYSTNSSICQAIGYLFDENDSSLYNESRIEQFYSLCIEYLDGNEIEYDEKAVYNVADEAAKIYSDTVGIHNASEMKYYVDDISQFCTRSISISLLLCVCAMVLLAIMYKQKAYASAWVGSGLLGGGIAMILGALISLIFKVGSDYDITPVIYQQGFYSMTHTFMLLLLLAGFVMLLIGAGVLVASIYQQNVEKKRKNTRFSKLIGKM